MNIRDLLERYKNGTAKEEEIRKVEEELENHLGMDEDDILIRFEQEDFTEVKFIKKEVRKKKATIILSSVAVMLTIFLGFKFILTPMLNGFYYNPEQYNYAAHHNDLSVKLATFTELHFPNKISKGVNVINNGISHYTFSFYQHDMFKDKVDTISGEIKRSSISLDEEFWQYAALEHFPNATYPVNSTLTTEQTINNIEKLPPYSYIKAYVSFEKDKNMEELAQIIDENANLELYISWIGIRNSEETVQNVPLIGFEPSGVGPIFEKMTEQYPYYELSNHTHSSSALSGEVFEKHFLELIQFQLDHGSFINMLGGDTLNRGYYDSVLEYVADNGIHSYGLVVQGYPSAILSLASQLDIFHIAVDEIKMAMPKE